MLNYAEWTSEEAHRRAGEGAAPPQIEDNLQWKEAHAWPGLTSTSFNRFVSRLSLAAP